MGYEHSHCKVGLALRVAENTDGLCCVKVALFIASCYNDHHSLAARVLHGSLELLAVSCCVVLTSVDVKCVVREQTEVQDLSSATLSALVSSVQHTSLVDRACARLTREREIGQRVSLQYDSQTHSNIPAAAN
jgi:CBS-domain-containing membrane protein